MFVSPLQYTPCHQDISNVIVHLQLFSAHHKLNGHVCYYIYRFSLAFVYLVSQNIIRLEIWSHPEIRRIPSGISDLIVHYLVSPVLILQGLTYYFHIELIYRVRVYVQKPEMEHENVYKSVRGNIRGRIHAVT